MSITERLNPEEHGTFGELRTDGVMRSPSRLSFSSVSTYSECGELWRLTRGFRQGEHSWWANPGGSTVHEVTELYDTGEWTPANLEDIKAKFKEIFAKHEAEYEGLELRASSKKGLNELCWAGGPNGKDREWWMLFGPQMVQAYISWRRNGYGAEFSILDVELPFEVELAGELLVGHIDRLEVHDESGALYIRDLKCGSSGNYLQLGFYREGLRKAHGIEADYGDMIKFKWETEKREVPMVDDAGEPVLFSRGPRKGQQKTETVDGGRVICFSSRATDFTGHTTEFIEHQLSMARTGIEAGVFLGNLRNNCQYCGVSDHCRSFGGREALTYPVKTEILPRKVLADTSPTL